jgi:hypothetical protein
VTTSQIQRRIFIVGVARSGTTLVQSLLATHTEVTSFTESHFFYRHFTHVPLRTLPILTKNPIRRVRDFLAENSEAPTAASQWLEVKGRGPLRAKPLRPFFTTAVARRLVELLDELALRRGFSSWLEKTPWHIRYIRLLERVCSDRPPEFVHVVRHGLDVVASLHKASQTWERSYDLDECVTRWNDEVALTLDRIDQPRHHIVLYEKLASEPEPTMRRLLRELDVEWQSEMLEGYGRTSDGLVTDDEPWKAGVGRSISRSESSRQALTDQQRERVQTALRADLYDRIAQRWADRSPDGEGVG